MELRYSPEYLLTADARNAATLIRWLEETIDLLEPGESGEPNGCPDSRRELLRLVVRTAYGITGSRKDRVDVEYRDLFFRLLYRRAMWVRNEQMDLYNRTTKKTHVADLIDLFVAVAGEEWRGRILAATFVADQDDWGDDDQGESHRRMEDLIWTTIHRLAHPPERGPGEHGWKKPFSEICKAMGWSTALTKLLRKTRQM